MQIRSVNPSNEQIIAQYRYDSDQEVARKINRAQKAFLAWRNSSVDDRRNLLEYLIQQLVQKREDIAAHISEEMGKPITQSLAEVEKCVAVCEYYREHGESLLASRVVDVAALHGKRMVCYQPLGPIYAVMPWNFPFWQVFRWIAPNIMAGNVGVLQHAWNVSGCANEIVRLWQGAPGPDHLLQNVIVAPHQAEKIISDQKIAAVTLTGSTRVGAIVGAAAGRYLKKTVMELGGSDPYIVLEDANIQKAARIIAHARLNNAGQSCIAAKRIIVLPKIKDEFQSALIEEMSQVKMGQPMRTDTTLGPLARADLRVQLHQLVLTSIAVGAKLVIGGKIPDGLGYYYPPTILTDVKSDMPCFKNEVFGPVACISEAKDEKEAIELANQSDYGLGAAIFSRDINHAESIAREKIDAGNCFINEAVSSHPALPFGGIKHSGYGRELSSEGFYEFMNIKTVVINEH